MTKTPIATKKEKKPALFPPWSPVVAILIVFATYFLGSLLGELAAYVYPLSQGWSIDEGIAWMRDSIVGRTVQVVAFYCSMAWLLYMFCKRFKVSFRQLGLLRPRFKDAGIALLAIPVYIAGYAVLLTTAIALFPSLDAKQDQQLGFDPGTDTLALALTFVSLVILPPLVEELTMRGFLFTSLTGRMRFIWAAIITSVIFAIAHLQFDSGAPLLWVAAIDTFVLSMVLCYMRYKTGSLWAGIFLHALKNGVAFLSLFVFHWG